MKKYSDQKNTKKSKATKNQVTGRKRKIKEIGETQQRFPKFPKISDDGKTQKIFINLNSACFRDLKLLYGNINSLYVFFKTLFSLI